MVYRHYALKSLDKLERGELEVRPLAASVDKWFMFMQKKAVAIEPRKRKDRKCPKIITCY